MAWQQDERRETNISVNTNRFEQTEGTKDASKVSEECQRGCTVLTLMSNPPVASFLRLDPVQNLCYSW